MQYCEPIEGCLGWQEQTWIPLQQRLQDIASAGINFLLNSPRWLVPMANWKRIRLAVTVSCYQSWIPLPEAEAASLEEEYRDLKAG